MQKITFEDTTVVKKPYIDLNGVEYELQDGQYQGGTDLNANTFNTMQNNIENAITNSVLFNQMFNMPAPNHILTSSDDLDDLYTEIGIKLYEIKDVLPISAPTGAYTYGTLIVITNTTTTSNYWNNIQIYIPDRPSIRGIYIRTSDSKWSYLTGTETSKIPS